MMAGPPPTIQVLDPLDPLDIELDSASSSSQSRRSRVPVPVALALLTGMAMGPSGAAVLPERALDIVDPAIPFALATLGVLVTLGLSDTRARGGHQSVTGVIEGSVTLLLVASGLGAWLPAVMDTPTQSLWLLALLLGICSATSMPLTPLTLRPSEEQGARVLHADGIFSIVAGGVALALIREGNLPGATSLLVQASGAVLVVAVAAWLLLTPASSDTERRMFSVAVLLLVGGAADYLSLSALCGGVVAGLLWRRVGGEVSESIRRDTSGNQHPLVMLLLLVAGARAEPTLAALALAVGYALLRALAKWASADVARRLVPRVWSPELRVQLLSPGVFGVLFALNALRAGGPGMSVLLTIVVLGTIGCELLATTVRRGAPLE